MKGSRWLLAALILLVAFGMGLVLRRYVIGTVRVSGVSMQDTLKSGDLALVTRLKYAYGGPERGDVVECRFPGRDDTYIKRIIGLPGDEVAFAGGRLTVNGSPVEEPYLSTPTEDYAITLGADEYLALGDNRADSYDSRMADMGPIGRADILGRVRWILLPLNRFGPIQ